MKTETQIQESINLLRKLFPKHHIQIDIYPTGGRIDLDACADCGSTEFYGEFWRYKKEETIDTAISKLEENYYEKGRICGGVEWRELPMMSWPSCEETVSDPYSSTLRRKEIEDGKIIKEQCPVDVTVRGLELRKETVAQMALLMEEASRNLAVVMELPETEKAQIRFFLPDELAGCAIMLREAYGIAPPKHDIGTMEEMK